MDALAELEKWREHFEWRFVLDHYQPCRVLDYGCGYGYSDIWLARNGFDVTGYDPNRDRIEVARFLREQQTPEIKALLRFGFSAEIPSIGLYDLVWCSHVLEHASFVEWADIFQNFANIGAPTLISVPLGHAYDMPEHIHHWDTAEDFTRDLAQFSAREWTVWEDSENHVIKARSE